MGFTGDRSADMVPSPLLLPVESSWKFNSHKVKDDEMELGLALDTNPLVFGEPPHKERGESIEVPRVLFLPQSGREYQKHWRICTPRSSGSRM